MNIPGIFNQKSTYTLLDYDNVQELVSEGLTDEVIKIISQVRKIYPFTFLEKEGIRRKIDDLENFFWIKNRFGFCELVNQELTEYFDTSFAQLEGNHEEIFFPIEMRRIIKSFNDIACETKKAVLLEGINFIDKERDVKFNLINIPLIDDEDTVIAIICLSCNLKSAKTNKTAENYSLERRLLTQFPNPAAILSCTGFIKQTNIAFQQLTSRKEQELENSLINKVFSPNFDKKFEEFLASELLEITIESSNFMPNSKMLLQITLGKIFEEKHIVTAILLVVKNQVKEELAGEHQDHFNVIENLIRNNPDAVLICDKENLKFLEVNETAINLYGYRRDEFLQMDLTDLYFAEDIQLLLNSSKANVREGNFHGPYKHKKKDGTVILVEMSGYSIKFLDREAHFTLVRNVTDKIESERRNLSYKSVFEHTDDLIFITDSAGFIQVVNQAVTKILGYTKNDLMNSSFASITSDEDRSRVNQLIFHSDKKETSSTHLNLKSIDGRNLKAEIMASPILDFNKEIESFTLLGRMKQSEFSTDLEGLKNTSDNSLVTGKGEEKIDIKFLSDLFHELLTSINVMVGFAQEITENTDKPKAEQKEASLIIKQNRANLLQTMNAAIEYASLAEKNQNLLIAETKITDIIDALMKDTDELKSFMDVEFAYGKISSSLKFETDHKRFTYFLSLLFKLAAKISGQKRIYFSAYPQDKENFIVTFKDLQNHSSKQLVRYLKSIFSDNENSQLNDFGFSRVFISLIQKLAKVLNGKFVVLSEEKDKHDYGIIFPIIYANPKTDEPKQVIIHEEKESGEENFPIKSIMEQNEEDIKKPQNIEPDTKSKSKLDQTEDLNKKLQNELRMEFLREKIRKKEADKKSKTKEEDEEEDSDEIVEDNIEFYDVDLHEGSDEQVEQEEIEVIETTVPKEKVAAVSKSKQTDEKIDISNLSCLYFEDQIDSQILFSVQMKGLKNLNFAVSFEESLPLLESTHYDFIVIDINLHGSYNGLDVLRIIRTMPQYENTPVFAVTAYVLPGDQHKFVLAGFNGFISKPIFRDQVIDLLAEVFKEPKHS